MFMDNSVEFEGSPQETALQKLWARRLNQAGCLVEEPEQALEEIFPPAVLQAENEKHPSPACEVIRGFLEHPSWTKNVRSKQRVLRLDGTQFNDFPARYVVPAIQAHEFPVVGVCVDPAVVPGFRYRVRPIEAQGVGKVSGHLFGGRALVLQSIGRGYSRRITFAGENLNDNDNYFWSDSRPNGYAFEIEVVSAGDKFTLHDANKMATGTLEVVRLQGHQLEVSHSVTATGRVEKRVRFEAIAKVEWFENQRAFVLPMSGVAVCCRDRGQVSAAVIRVTDVAVGSQQRRGFTLSPGVSNRWRRAVVHGRNIGDVPTSYTVIGLEAHELPVIGTFVDPRILPGFEYRVRPAGSSRPLFGGRTVRLVSVGPGYGKRLTFVPETGRLNDNANHLWSDTYPEGLGFEPRAVAAGQWFYVTSGGLTLGEATVFRADGKQQELDEERVSVAGEVTFIKHIQVDVTCLVKLTSTQELREPQLMRISGVAIVARSSNERLARLKRIESIGLASQLNLLFVRERAELVFYPV